MSKHELRSRMFSVELTVVTVAAGTASAATPDPITGRLVAVIYTKTDYANTVDFTITSTTTGQNLWVEANVTASGVRYPRAAVCDTSAVALTYDGTHGIYEPPLVYNETVTVVLAQGGATKTGKFTFIFEG